MSPYGPPTPSNSLRDPSTLLPATRYKLKPTTLGASAPTPASAPAPGRASLTVVHAVSATLPPALADHLSAEFQAELDRGRTYPQEGPITRGAFDGYFLGHDLFVGIIEGEGEGGGEGGGEGDTCPASLDDARGARTWAQCVAGVYYVKPNYPGRSSHICNAGFLVMPQFRGRGVATALARSYVGYAPRLGYKASVFNLVYVNNTASVRIWDQLGFEKVWRIPHAGRLRRAEKDGDGEEYVDAWVVYKAF